MPFSMSFLPSPSLHKTCMPHISSLVLRNGGRGMLVPPSLFLGSTMDENNMGCS